MDTDEKNAPNEDLLLLSDEDLMARVQDGDSACVDILLERYKPLVLQKARKLYLVGADKDDLIQEGMIGLYKAIRDYKADREAGFSTFANLCVSRQLYCAVRTSNRKKHLPLNNYVTLSDETWTMTEASPEEVFVDKEKKDRIEKALRENLSKFERKVLEQYLAGQDYRSIAGILQREPKSVDNALQRVKSKLRKILLDFQN